MGADVFFTAACGKTAREAFDEAVRRACYDHGHSGYSGTIAEKEGFVMIPLPEEKGTATFANELIDDDDHRIQDKWGPAGCIEMKDNERTDFADGTRGFLFFGWASS